MKFGGSEKNLKDFEKKVESMVDSKIETAIEERIERDRRKLNLLFVNVQESTGDKEEKMEGDMKKVKELIQKIVPEEAQRIKVTNPDEAWSSECRKQTTTAQNTS